MNRIVCKLKDTEKQMAEINRAFGLLNEAKDKLFKLYTRTNYVLEDAPAAASDEENPTVCEQLKECLKEAIIRQNRNAEDGDFIEAIKGQSECKVLAQALSDLGCETEITFTRGHTLCYTARIREARAKQPAITGIEMFSAKYMNKIYDGSTTGTIQCSVSADNIISCKIVSGSVSKTLLTEALQTEIDQKADKAQTLSGYGITDAYTKAEVDAKTAYASQSQKGTVRIWTSYDGDEAVLNISTEDIEDET